MDEPEQGWRAGDQFLVDLLDGRRCPAGSWPTRRWHVPMPEHEVVARAAMPTNPKIELDAGRSRLERGLWPERSHLPGLFTRHGPIGHPPSAYCGTARPRDEWNYRHGSGPHLRDTRERGRVRRHRWLPVDGAGRGDLAGHRPRHRPTGGARAADLSAVDGGGPGAGTGCPHRCRRPLRRPAPVPRLHRRCPADGALRRRGQHRADRGHGTGVYGRPVRRSGRWPAASAGAGRQHAGPGCWSRRWAMRVRWSRTARSGRGWPGSA